MTGVTVLCVDPDESARESTVAGLRAGLADATVEAVGSVAAAKRALRERSIDCLVTEYHLPDGTGIDLVEAARELAPDTACVLFTDADTDAIAEPAGVGVVEYLPKGRPDAVDRLVGLLETATSLRSQTSYPVPQDEDARVAALDALGLDADRLREPLDRLTTLAADHLGTPRASINVIREHTQEFLTCHGADWSTSSRQDSICTFTIVSGDRVLAVPDVEEDPRFESVTVLDELGIRAYMGATLATEEGYAVGTLCVYDSQPREFTDAEAETLIRYADVVADIVGLGRDLQRQRRGEDR